MKTIGEITGRQEREFATLIANETGHSQPNRLFFVQMDDFYAVDNEGSIYQITNEEGGTLQYEGDESGNIYNYAEDTADFDEDTEDADIYSHCFQQAIWNFEDAV